jgi:hypothetical protein
MRGIAISAAAFLPAVTLKDEMILGKAVSRQGAAFIFGPLDGDPLFPLSY